MSEVKSDEKREKFIKFAEKRVNNAMKSISLIGNLANKNNYRYDESDIEKILKALRAEIAELESRFKTQRSGSKTFTL
jgi:hypothetical protein